MLIFMRKHAKFFYVFFVIIIISFIFFYAGPIHDKETIAIIEIGDKKLYLTDYWRLHDNLRNYFQNTYQGQFTPEMEKTLKLKDKTIELMVANQLLLIAAEKYGFEVTDNELNDSIINDPAFKRDNVFKEEVYNRVLQLNRITVGAFETKRREELTIAKVRNFIGLSSGFVISDLPRELTADPKTMQSILPQILMDSKEKALISYINSMKKTIPIKIRYEMIS